MHWYIAAPFSRKVSDQWLGKFSPGEQHTFSSIPANYQHDRSRPSTNRREWVDHFGHGIRAWRTAHAAKAGVITCFPQIPVAAGICNNVVGSNVPIVAWAFNLGVTPGGLKQKISQYALRSVDRFVVHSTDEVDVCSRWLQLPASRFAFVPLQRGLLDVKFGEDDQEPYIVALGTAHRDYGLLIQSLQRLKYKTIIVAGASALAGLDVPAHVEVYSSLSIEACHRLLQKARISIVPISNQKTASGQVTLIDSMMFAKPTIVTRCPGSVDYVEDGVDAVLVPPSDVVALEQAIEWLWNDASARKNLALHARRRVVADFSDEAIGIKLKSVLDAVVS